MQEPDFIIASDNTILVKFGEKFQTEYGSMFFHSVNTLSKIHFDSLSDYHRVIVPYL